MSEAGTAARDGTIRVERDGAIATIVLHRPDKLNALTRSMWQCLGTTMNRLSADDSLRCVVVRGAGEKSFSPGNDIGEFETARANREQAIAYGAIMHDAARAIAECRHPTIARIHGICVGGGLEIAALCDLRICGEGSRFGAPIKDLGLVMAYPEIAPLVELVGRAVALEILYEGRIFGAREAYEKRLVNRVVPDDRVAQECLESARRIAGGAPLVARWHKKFVRRLSSAVPLTDEERLEAFDCFDTDDFRTGYRAFLAKTRPDFAGR